MATYDTLVDLKGQLRQARDAEAAAFQEYSAKKEIADTLSEAVTAMEKVIALTGGFVANGRVVVTGSASMNGRTETPEAEKPAIQRTSVKYPALKRLILELLDTTRRPWSVHEMRNHFHENGQIDPAIKDPLEAIRVACIRLEKNENALRKVATNTYERVYAPAALSSDP